jgi:N-acetylglucosamine-6-phosphate deacetylase
MKALLATRVFDGGGFIGPSAVLFEHGRVIDLTGAADVPEGVAVELLPDDAILAPGFVDLQVNGGGGVMFNADPTPATLARIAEAHARLGTTAVMPTLISSDRATRRAAIAAARAAWAEKIPGVVGLHLEGPFLAPARRGIHPAEAITTPDAEDLAELTAAFAAPVMITLAPEIVAAADIAALAAAGRLVFAGHSDASFEQAQAGFEAGIIGSTHLFNAMSQLTGRAPGLVGAALSRGVAGIIVDLLHVHPASVALAFARMGAERLFLVSDAMATAGSDMTSFDLAGRTIRLVDNKLTGADGTLAGAHLCMAEAVRRAVQDVGIPLAAALRMATQTPADAVGLAEHGRIASGSRADFVVLDSALTVRAVWRDGEKLAGIRSTVSPAWC